MSEPTAGSVDSGQVGISMERAPATPHAPWDFCVVFDKVTDEELESARNDLCCWRRDRRLAELEKQMNFIGTPPQ